MADKIMLGYTYTPGLLAPFNKLPIPNRGLIRDCMDYSIITGPFDEDVTPEVVAFHLCEDPEYIASLWDPRTQAGWVHARQYMVRLIGEREDFVDTKVVAGLLSAESKKDSVSLEEAHGILGDLMPVYEAFATHWAHKKVTSDDCRKVKALIEGGKTTANQMIRAIESLARNTSLEKRQYMKGVSTWLSAGGWMGRDSTQKEKLDQCNQDSKDSILAAMGGQ